MSPEQHHRVVLEYAERAKALWRTTTTEQRDAGRRWYDEAHLMCSVLGEQYRVATATVAAIVAALSPSCAWALRTDDPWKYKNLYDAESVLLERKVPKESRRSYSTYKRNVAKARAILRADNGRCPRCVPELLIRDILCPKDEVNKTLRFYSLIMQKGRSDYACVDSHIARAVMGLEGYRVEVWPALYMRLEQALQRAAEPTPQTTAQLTAALWLQERERRANVDVA